MIFIAVPTHFDLFYTWWNGLRSSCGGGFPPRNCWPGARLKCSAWTCCRWTHLSRFFRSRARFGVRRVGVWGERFSSSCVKLHVFLLGAGFKGNQGPIVLGFFYFESTGPVGVIISGRFAPTERPIGPIKIQDPTLANPSKSILTKSIPYRTLAAWTTFGTPQNKNPKTMHEYGALAHMDLLCAVSY